MAAEMTPNEMSQERFAALVEAYGAQARRWPEDEREAALAFTHAHPEIAEPLLSQARALDAVLDTDAAPAHVNDLLAARILASAKREAAQRARLDWKPLAALAACAVFELVVGFGAGHLAPTAAAPPQVVAQSDDHQDAEAAIDAAFGMLDIHVDDAGEGG